MDAFSVKQSRFASGAPWSPGASANTMNAPRVRRNIILGFLSILGLFFFLHLPSGTSVQNRISSQISSLNPGQTSEHKYAYVAFLAPMKENTPTGEEIKDENHYLVGIRMLIYQLLHDPVTR